MVRQRLANDESANDADVAQAFAAASGAHQPVGSPAPFNCQSLWPRVTDGFYVAHTNPIPAQKMTGGRPPTAHLAFSTDGLTRFLFHPRQSLWSTAHFTHVHRTVARLWRCQGDDCLARLTHPPAPQPEDGLCAVPPLAQFERRPASASASASAREQARKAKNAKKAKKAPHQPRKPNRFDNEVTPATLLKVSGQTGNALQLFGAGIQQAGCCPASIF